MEASFHICSAPPTGSSAIAIVELTGGVDEVLAALGMGPVAVGRVGLREAPGVDTMIVARMSDRHALLFPHAGPAVLTRVVTALTNAGARAWAESTATDGITPPHGLAARLDAALARAASPLAIDLLLEQPARWAAAEASGLSGAWLSDGESRVLNRLIDPPLVAAIGPPNVGKSSLLNALAGRTVSVVADAPGTTRDHVGVMLNLGGLVVRFIDAPGLGAAGHRGTADREIQGASQKLALAAAAGADLVLRCGDRASGFVDGVLSDRPSLTVALRSDLGAPDGVADASVSLRPAAAWRGLDELVRLVRDRLVPPALLADQRAWRFG